jgi:hypothetical protein
MIRSSLFRQSKIAPGPDLTFSPVILAVIRPHLLVYSMPSICPDVGRSAHRQGAYLNRASLSCDLSVAARNTSHMASALSCTSIDVPTLL